MCTVVVLFRPGDPWPVILGANRDEMKDRPWRPPGRHWPDRPEVAAGMDELAGGTWLGMNDHGLVAGVLNRRHSLGPAPDMRSRGELPLEALDHAEARVAAQALSRIDPRSYRTFNLVIADRREAFWLRSRGGFAPDAPNAVEVMPIPPGLSMLTAYDLNDPESKRIRRYRPLFREAPAPDPDAGAFDAWKALLAAKETEPGAGPGGAMTVTSDTGFGTVCASLIALPAPGRGATKPAWLFAPGAPGTVPWNPVAV